MLLGDLNNIKSQVCGELVGFYEVEKFITQKHFKNRPFEPNLRVASAYNNRATYKVL